MIIIAVIVFKLKKSMLNPDLAFPDPNFQPNLAIFHQCALFDVVSSTLQQKLESPKVVNLCQQIFASILMCSFISRRIHNVFRAVREWGAGWGDRPLPAPFFVNFTYFPENLTQKASKFRSF